MWLLTVCDGHLGTDQTIRTRFLSSKPLLLCPLLTFTFCNTNPSISPYFNHLSRSTSESSYPVRSGRSPAVDRLKSNTYNMFWPRLQLLEIGDQPWCPSWLHQHEQLSLTKLWNLQAPFSSHGSLATQACKIFKEQLADISSYTVLDICAGSGGPTPVLESELNGELEAQGKPPIQFILSDLHPHVEEWERISKKQQNISYIETPVDARAVPRMGRRKECRIFNLCFHHFNDEDAMGILKSAIQSADSFM